MEINKIYNEDCLVTLGRMEDNSVDLIVTSPPYNKGWYADKNAKKSNVWGNLNGRKIQYDTFSDEMPPQEYEAWQRKILDECIRVLKPEGSLFYNHKDIINKGLIVPPKWVYDYKVKQQIIWDRGSSPMLDPHYFFPLHEWIYWIVKEPAKTFFDKTRALIKSNIWRMNYEPSAHPAPFPKMLVTNCILSCSRGGQQYMTRLWAAAPRLSALWKRARGEDLSAAR